MGHVSLPPNETSINREAFSGWFALVTIPIPDTVHTLRDRCFENCMSLTSVTIPNLVQEVPSLAFRGCITLTTVNLPTGLTSIGCRAFHTCTSLTSINILDNVEVMDIVCWTIVSTYDRFAYLAGYNMFRPLLSKVVPGWQTSSCMTMGQGLDCLLSKTVVV